MCVWVRACVCGWATRSGTPWSQSRPAWWPAAAQAAWRLGPHGQGAGRTGLARRVRGLRVPTQSRQRRVHEPATPPPQPHPSPRPASTTTTAAAASTGASSGAVAVAGPGPQAAVPPLPPVCTWRQPCAPARPGAPPAPVPRGPACLHGEDASSGAWLAPVNVPCKHDLHLDAECTSHSCRGRALVRHRQSPGDKLEKPRTWRARAACDCGRCSRRPCLAARGRRASIPWQPSRPTRPWDAGVSTRRKAVVGGFPSAFHRQSWHLLQGPQCEAGFQEDLVDLGTMGFWADAKQWWTTPRPWN